jgi:Domain of unknown function (DUF5916)
VATDVKVGNISNASDAASGAGTDLRLEVLMLLALTCLASLAASGPRVTSDSPQVVRQGSGARGDSLVAPQRLVRAVRATKPAASNATSSDAPWPSADRVTGFVQRDPNEGTAPSESTVVWVGYDDAALYVVARMYDSHPDSIVGRLGRRDAVTNSDQFTVFIDPYHDRRSGYYFGVDAAGTLSDGTLYNDDWNDATWDGVWEGKATRDSLGWVAEFRIPYSQLRFIQRTEYVWGINFRRDIARKNERDYLTYTPKNGSGFVSRFPDLVGIERVTPPPRVEIMPYTTGKAEFAPRTAGNPFSTASTLSPGVGGDARIGLGPNLTLNATVNPDFGQVEVDPAVVNLSDVETFFQEKRPFFIEGSSIFDFGHGGANNYWGFNWGGPQFFYSRRIGRAPQGAVPEGANSDSSYADVPAGAHILGALKLTGKVGSSWNVGALSALTARETASIDTSGVLFQKEVEPLAYYGVFRAQKEFPEGRRGFGFMSTVAARGFRDPSLRDDVNSSSFALGADGWTFLDHEKDWVLTGWAGATRVNGDAARITAVQENSLHYFQRPDALHTRVDSSATSLDGWAARLYLNKQKGDWYSNSAIGVLSPGFDVDDVGFFFRSGIVNAHIGAGHQWTKTNRTFRYAELGGALFRSYDWDGNITWSGVYHFGDFQLLNYHWFKWDFAYNPWTVNNRRTRGGPLTLNPPGYQVDLGWQSDTRRPVVFNVSWGTYQAPSDRNWYFTPSVDLRPKSNVLVSLGPSLSHELTPVQYIDTYTDNLATATFEHRYVFGTLSQTQLSASIRLNWTYSPTLSLQLYAQPLISAGRYADFKEVARPRSYDFTIYGRDAGTITRTSDGTYVVHPVTGNATDSLTFSDPNFNLVSLRGNAVLRWEYRPGSTIYLVWTQTRSDNQNIGDFQFGPSISRMLSARADNIFLIKLTYWWNP